MQKCFNVYMVKLDIESTSDEINGVIYSYRNLCHEFYETKSMRTIIHLYPNFYSQLIDNCGCDW